MVHTVENIKLNENVYMSWVKNELKSINYIMNSGRYYVLIQINNCVTAYLKTKNECI